MKKAFQLFVPVVVILAMMLSFVPAHPVQAVSADIVISQVYGGGGNSGATYRNDFVELYNRGTATVSLDGWSIQYASSTGTGNFGSTTTQITPLSGSIAPGQYFLVQEASNAAVGALLPTPDLTDASPIAMAAGAGKVALANVAVSLGCNGGSTLCDASQLAEIVDLVGYGGANFFEGAGPAPTISAILADFRASSGCTDTDNNSADFAAATPAPRNTSSPLNVCTIVADTAPTVTSSVPLDGVTNFPVGSDLSVSFSEPVNVTDPWFSLTCSVSGSVPAVVTGGPSTFTINPDTSLVSGESCTLQVFAAGVSDQDLLDPPDTMDADYSVAFTPFDVCVQTFTPIYDIQGSGATVALTGSRTTMGVVVGDYEGASPDLRGFFIQDKTGDGNPATSDGIFVFEGSNANTVNLGDVVRVTGNAGENQGQSQISVGTITKCGTGSVDPADVTFPVPSLTYLEQYEGMLVRLPQTMFVTEHFQLGRFDQVVISADARLQQPTNVTTPGAEALALQEQNNLNKIILDDASQAQNPDPILFARDGAPLSAANTLRGGDTATNIVGVMTYTWAGNSASPNTYRIRPINALDGYVNFEPTNPRPVAAPERSGSLRVVGMNLLNFFNTFTGCTNGFGGAPTDCRGADTQTEFDRQWPKTVAAIISANADIFGFTEIENDGYGPDSAIQDLVNKLNAAAGEGTYAFIDADTGTGQINALGTDAIKVGFVYKTSTVMPIGATAALNSVEFVNGGDTAARNRPALAQAFQEVSTGARFVVAVNHLKSKGSACDAPDAFDGQGNCNQVRVNAATLLSQWLAGDPTGSGDPDALIIGDLNSYAMEDPITALLAAGYTNLVKEFGGDEAYSYVFDGQWGYLDHALSNSSLTAQVANVADWHIDADEPSVLDYNTDFKTANLISSLYAPDFYRIGDHDPVLIDLNLTPTILDKSGFVTGSGWFVSPAPDSYKAKFDVSVKYHKGILVPEGITELILSKDMTFTSTSYAWLVVSGKQAILQGTGTINGEGEYSFLVTMKDGSPDQIKVMIWDANGVVYNTGGLVNLGGGQIQFH